MKRWAHKRRDMKDKMRKHNMYLIGVHEGRDREGQRQRCEDDDWEISRHDKRHSRIPMNLQKQLFFLMFTSKDITIKVQNFKDKEKILITAKEVKDHLQKRRVRFITAFSTAIMEVRR